MTDHSDRTGQTQPPPSAADRTAVSGSLETKAILASAAEEPSPGSPEKVTVDPALRPEASGTEKTSAPARPSSREGSAPSPREELRAGASSDMESQPRPPARTWLGLPVWGWLLGACGALGLLFIVSDLHNRDRFVVVCNSNKVEVRQGRRLPWPFGDEPVGGPEYQPVSVSTDACPRPQTFPSEEEASRAFLDVLLGQVRTALSGSDAATLREARQQLAQATLLTRVFPARRKEAQSLLADLSYREGRTGLARAESELRLALSRFQETQKLDSSRFEDLDAWITHLEEILRTISPSPFSSTTPSAVGHGPSSAPGSQPALMRSTPRTPGPRPFDAGLAPGSGASDGAAPPAAGTGILM